MLRDENATVLQFRDTALRRPIDVVAWMNAHAPHPIESAPAEDNVIPLGRFARATRRRDSRTSWTPPGGDAA